MVNKTCAYGLCKSDSRHYGRPKMEGVAFIYFPQPRKDKEKCKRWVRACGRPAEGAGCFTEDSVTKDTYICSKHFVAGNGPTPIHPDPVPALASEVEKIAFEKKKKRPCPKERQYARASGSKKPARSNPSAVLTPTESVVTGRPTASDIGVFSSKKSRSESSAVLSPTEPVVTSNTSATAGQGEQVSDVTSYQEQNVTPTKEPINRAAPRTPFLLRHVLQREPNLKKQLMTTTGTQTDLTSSPRFSAGDVVFNELSDDDLMGSLKQLKRTLFKASVFRDDQTCKFYTGLTVVGFGLLLNFVSNVASRMTYWRGEETGPDGVVPNRRDQTGTQRLLTLKEELLVVLVRLRRALEVNMLSDLMGVSSSLVSRIFITWIHMLSRELCFLIKWPTRARVLSRLPRAFRFFPKTRVIIDCTEFQLQKPSLPSVQRKTYSSYKHRNTAKCLVGVTPRGAFSFVSDIWTGSISDRKIVEMSGFLEMLEAGDDVMADRGFLIRDLVTLRKATLNIPPFAHGRQMAKSAVTKTRRIAAVRIHVERAIGRLKQFRLLSETIPAPLNPLVHMCVTVAAALCNLEKPLCR
ncbi:uncharacterized protein [Littorina saxatilis]|uniref:THAP-type domain-containing protein n=1 Tax=Littorina saxatilis TaxID=31220 RepID=A0AAN9GAV6_9CAEN